MNQPSNPTVEEDLIFDVGCHQGEDTAYYLARGFRVVAVECAPAQLEIIRSRFKTEIADGRLTLIERAIAAKNGPITFYDNPGKSVWGTADPAWAQRNRNLGTKVEEITVEGIQAEELFQNYGIPFYLKVDIEGFDLMVFRALSGFAARPPYASIEAEARSMRALQDEFSVLSDLGYDRFKLSAQQHVQRHRVPGFSLQGRPVAWEFKPGSSGLFGEDIPGPWLDEKRALASYEPIMVIYDVERAIQQSILSGSLRGFLSRFGYELGWYDTHARHESWSGRPPRASFSPFSAGSGGDNIVEEKAVGEDEDLDEFMSQLAACADSLKYVTRACGQRKPGVDEVPDWQVWTEQPTTADQKRIEEQLERLLFEDARLLHIGAGNSSLGRRFAPRIREVVGTTIHDEECDLAESLGLPNYSVVNLNKYSRDMDLLEGPFDFIVDNNPASFACCLSHFARMLLNYASLLKENGILLMAQPGMHWVVTNNDPNWSLSLEDWERIGQTMQMPVKEIGSMVFAMQRNNLLPDSP